MKRNLLILSLVVLAACAPTVAEVKAPEVPPSPPGECLETKVARSFSNAADYLLDAAGEGWTSAKESCIKDLDFDCIQSLDCIRDTCDI